MRLFYDRIAGDGLLLLQSLVLLPVCVCGLKALGLSGAWNLADRLGPPPATPDRPTGDAARILEPASRAVHRASRMLRAGTCLSRSLALYILLRRRGIATTLKIGFSRDRETLSAHAWLERDGVPVEYMHPAGTPGTEFVPFRAGDNP